MVALRNEPGDWQSQTGERTRRIDASHSGSSHILSESLTKCQKLLSYGEICPMSLTDRSYRSMKNSPAPTQESKRVMGGWTKLVVKTRGRRSPITSQLTKRKIRLRGQYTTPLLLYGVGESVTKTKNNHQGQ